MLAGVEGVVRGCMEVDDGQSLDRRTIGALPQIGPDVHRALLLCDCLFCVCLCLSVSVCLYVTTPGPYFHSVPSRLAVYNYLRL